MTEIEMSLDNNYSQRVTNECVEGNNSALFSQLVLTPQCDGIAVLPSPQPLDEVVDSVEIRHVYTVYVGLWGLSCLPPERAHNPAPLPTSLTRKSLCTLHSNEYVVSAKIDGLRMLLLMTEFNGIPKAYMIDRPGRVFIIKLMAPLSLFKSGLLVDGELAWTDEEPNDSFQPAIRYHIFDAMNINGITVTTESYEARMQMVKKIFHVDDITLDTIRHQCHSQTNDNNTSVATNVMNNNNEINNNHKNHNIIVTDDGSRLYQHGTVNITPHSVVQSQGVVLAVNNLNNMEICVKPFKSLNAIDQLIVSTKCSEDRMDGLIFTHRWRKQGTGRTKATIKYKPIQTVDLQFLFNSKMSSWDIICRIGKNDELCNVNVALRCHSTKGNIHVTDQQNNLQSIQSRHEHDVQEEDYHNNLFYLSISKQPNLLLEKLMDNQMASRIAGGVHSNAPMTVLECAIEEHVVNPFENLENTEFTLSSDTNKYDRQTKHMILFPLRNRHDKSMSGPNHISTIYDTAMNILENITMADIIKKCAS